MTAIEPGPAMGFFTLDLLPGESGRADELWRSISNRACSKHCDGAPPRPASPNEFRRGSRRRRASALYDLAGQADFVLAFAVVHEMPNAARFFAEVAACLKPGGAMLLAEPTGHVSADAFASELQAAAAAGLTARQRPSIRSSHAALLVKAGD